MQSVDRHPLAADRVSVVPHEANPLFADLLIGITSMAKKLRLTNGELVTSKEELQSMNEELTRVNAQLQDKVQEVTTVNDDLANLLVSTDIATVFVDAELRIRRFTTAATRLLHLLPGDRGRPIGHFATSLVGVDLAAEARTVLTTHVPSEREASAQDGREYIIRVVPYRTGGQQVQGVVLTLVDVTNLKGTQRALSAANERVSEDLRRMSLLHSLSEEVSGERELSAVLGRIVQTALDVTGADMGNIQILDETGGLEIAAHVGFTQPFLDFFSRVEVHTDSVCGRALEARHRAIVEDVTTSEIFQNSPALAVLLSAGVRAVQSTPLFGRSGDLLGMLSTHYHAPRRIADTDQRWLDLLAGHAQQAIERIRTDRLLEAARQELEHRVHERTAWLALMHSVTQAVREAPIWDDALRRVLRHLCDLENWQVGHVYLPDPDDSETLVASVSYGDKRFEPFHRLSRQQRYARGDRLPGRVYAEGRPLWINSPESLAEQLPARAECANQLGLKAGVALPVSVGEEVVAVIELFSVYPHEPNDELMALMRDVGDQVSRVIERERANAQIADLVWRGQQDLLHTLHDSLGQSLTGLGMLAKALSQRLKDLDQPALDLTQQIVAQAQEALDQVRQLSRGLLPVEITADGLVTALRHLAATIEALHHVRVEVEDDGYKPDGVDVRITTQLYRIAQEAVTNAVKHAQARAIHLQVRSVSGRTTLRIIDDGIGFSLPGPHHQGLGLRIMRHRANAIGAVLSIDPVTDGGTAVTCTLRAAPH
jgi:signal transduction histidine kinase